MPQVQVDGSSVSPGAQGTQLPAQQTVFVGQTLPQLPQLASSVWVLAHHWAPVWSRQRVVPSGQRQRPWPFA